MSYASVRKLRWSVALAGVAGLATLTIAGTAGAGAPPASVTATQEGALSTVVRYADLDLASNQGVAVLYRRLRGAAERVCAPLKSPALASRRPWRECYETALGNAVAGVGNEQLAALYRGRDASRRPQALQVSRVE